MVLDYVLRLLGKQDRGKRCIQFFAGRPREAENPLPALFPHLYGSSTADEFRLRDKMLEDAGTVMGDLLHALCLDSKRWGEALLPNIALMLDIPQVYDSLRLLSGEEHRCLYRGTFALAGLVQVCAAFGDSRTAQKANENLLPALLGVFCRTLAFGSLPASQKKTLVSRVQFDVTNARQKELRDQFLDDYRAANEALAEGSSKKLADMIRKCPEPVAQIVRDIVDYSTRLTGRAASRIPQDELKGVHALAHYAATLHGIAAAFSGKKKRPVLVLAEEWSRIGSDCRNKLLEEMSGRSADAVRDTIKAARCAFLKDFQGSGREALYSVPENIVAKEVEIRAEMDPSESKRILRYATSEEELTRAKRQSIRSFARKDTSRSLRKSRRMVKQLRWECFRPKEHIDVENRARRELKAKGQIGQLDPPDDELTPLE